MLIPRPTSKPSTSVCHQMSPEGHPAKTSTPSLNISQDLSGEESITSLLSHLGMSRSSSWRLVLMEQPIKSRGPLLRRCGLYPPRWALASVSPSSEQPATTANPPNRCLSDDEPVDLINVAFSPQGSSTFQTPDRLSGIEAWNELQEACPREWRLVTINVSFEVYLEPQKLSERD